MSILYETINEKSYPSTVKLMTKILSVNKNSPGTIFGSYNIRIQKYPSDIDLYEIFKGKNTIDQLYNKFYKLIVKVINHLNSIKSTYISEFKAGLDLRYSDVQVHHIGKLCNNIWTIYDKNKTSNNIIQLYYNNLIEENDYYTLISIIKKKNLNGNDFDIFNFIVREYYIIRWTNNDLIKRYKILKNNFKMKLLDAIKFKTDIKIDTITLIDNKYIEMTNWFLLIFENNGNDIVLNNDQLVVNDLNQFITSGLKKEIDKLFFSKLYFNPFKGIKRIWALSRLNKDTDTLETLRPIISGNISYLYQINGDLKTILTLIKQFNLGKLVSIHDQLDNVKIKLNRSDLLNTNQINQFNNLIDDINKSKKNNKIKLLDKLTDNIKSIIDKQSIEQLNNSNFTDLSKFIFPYNRYFMSS